MPRRTIESPSLLARAPKSWKQPRSKVTHEALVRAAREVFEEKGYDAAQTPDIAKAAGVSTGAFYRYFKDKKAVFLEVLVLHLGAARDSVHTRLSKDRFVGADARTAIDVVLDVLFEVIRKDARIHRVFMAASMSDPEVAALRAEFEAEERRRLSRLIAAIVPRGVVADTDAAAVVFQVAAVEIAIDQSGLRPRRGEEADRREVKRALGDMFFRYLFASPRPTRRAAHAAPRGRSRRAG
jgi:AcrR family transcriptional regulator